MTPAGRGPDDEGDEVDLAEQLASWYRRRPVRGRLRRGVRRLARAVDRLEHGHRGAWYDPEHNGEATLLARLGQGADVHTVLDVGANVGDWYRLARRHLPRARIVCVEVAPPLWDGLADLLADDPRASLARYGLAEAPGTVTLHYFPEASALTTTVAFPHPARAVELEAEVRTPAQLLDEHGLDRLDVVKVDVEGAELPVVRGLAPLMADGRVGLVQFEYGQANILTRSLLHDYAELAEAHDYRLGRVTPAGVRFRGYQLDDEDFRPRNMVLCRPDLVGVVGTDPSPRPARSSR